MEIQNEKKVAVTALSGNTAKEPVSVMIPQGYEQKINIRFVQASDIGQKGMYARCRPRTGAHKDVKDTLDLPAGFIDRMGDINKKVMAWLSQSADNATAFLHNPVAALQKAGVEMTREEQKHLVRNTEEIKASAVVAPGAAVTHFTAATGKGKVVRADNDGIKPHKDRDKGKEKDCGCS